jgi:hypothetical protein
LASSSSLIALVAGTFSPPLLMLLPSATAASDDPSSDDILDRFGLDLSSSPPAPPQRSSKWPKDSPSPLPTTKRSAQELTQDPDPASAVAAGKDDRGDDDGGFGGSVPSDMQNALRNAAKKKVIDPRTHG